MRIFVLLLVITLFFAGSSVFAEVDSYKDALSCYQEGDFEAAVGYLMEYVEKNPDPHAYYLLGYASYKLKNFSEAMEYFNEAYTIDPNFSPPQLEK